MFFLLTFSPAKITRKWRQLGKPLRYLPKAIKTDDFNHNLGESNGGSNAMTKAMVHYGPEHARIQTEVLGHSLVRSLVRSHRSIVRLLRTARFARALRCAHSFARSLTSLTPSLVGK